MFVPFGPAAANDPSAAEVPDLGSKTMPRKSLVSVLCHPFPPLQDPKRLPKVKNENL